jgi:20S proteasome subunit beta 1
MSQFSLNPYGLKEGELSSGTTIMGVCFDGGVILGADSRTSTGSYIANRVADKVVPLHDNIWTCRSGSAADTQAVADYVRHYLGSHATELGRAPKVKTAATLMAKITYNNKDRMQAGLICGGWDPYDGGQIFEIPLGGTLVPQKFAVGGSGSTYIFGLVDANYRDNMSKEECKEFVKTSISHAMARDGSSGGVIRLVCITKDGVEKTVYTGDELPMTQC